MGRVGERTSSARQAVTTKPGSGIHHRSFADIISHPVEWLWDGYSPLGTITLLDGNPDLGKSFLTVDVAARVSRGWPMPPADQGTEVTKPRNVLMLSAEDDPGRTIRPRLEAAGAELARVHFLEEFETGPAVLPDDLDRIEMIIQETRAQLVVIDPLFAYLSGQCDSNKDQDVRHVMHRMKGMAERARCAVLMVRHLNKRSADSQPIYRGGGSIGILGASRSTLLLGPHPEQDGVRGVARIKGNLSPQPPTLGFRFESMELATGPTARLTWIGELSVDTADLLGHHAGRRKGSTFQKACEWLTKELASGEKLSTAVEAAAKKAGVSESTLKRAKAALKVDSFRQGSVWLWGLPGSPGADQQDQETGQGDQGGAL